MALAAASGPAFTPSMDWDKEKSPIKNEPKLFEDFANKILEYQAKDATNGKRLRGFHAKIHTGLIGEFEVLPDLPDYARQGVFKTPRRFPALVRFSNGESTIQEDSNKEPRGIAIKLIGVDGPQVLPERRDAVTQDFLATSHSVTSAVRNVKQFMAFVKAHRHKPGIALPMLFFTLGPFEMFQILSILNRTVRKSDVRSMATEHYSGTAPIQFGPYAVKFTVLPEAGTAPPPAEVSPDKNFLQKELADRLLKADLVLDFLVQFYLDKERTPIENTSIPWLPDNSPLLRVAQLRIPSCKLDKGLTDKVDDLSFSPWHAIEDHRPLGNVMRARRVAYEVSANGRGHRPEPTALPL